MAGTRAGGLKAAIKNKELHGEDFYRNIGWMGGAIKNSKKGFGSMDKNKIKKAGAKGGSKGKRKSYYLIVATKGAETLTLSAKELSQKLGVDYSTINIGARMEGQCKGWKLKRIKREIAPNKHINNGTVEDFRKAALKMLAAERKNEG